MVTGVARAPRGIWLLNWETGSIVWRCPTAGTPTGGRAVADIDGDGAPEFVVGIESPGNGVTVGEWHDDAAYLDAFELDGRVLWWREVGGYSAEIALDVGDLDGDGLLEIVTGVGAHSEDDAASFRVAVWRGTDGTLLAELPLGVSVNGVAVAECEEGPRIFAGSSDGRVRRLRLDGGALVVEGEIDCREGVHQLACARFDPTIEGPVIVAGLKSGSIAALTERLRPVAFFRIDDASNRPTLGAIHAARFRVGGGIVRGIQYTTLTQLRSLYLARNPLPFPLKIALAVAAALGLVAAVPGLRRRSLALLRRAVLPKAGRAAALDELLARLATASHGKLAATGTFRRLREQLAMLSLYEGEPPEVFSDRFRAAVDDAREIGLPTVREIGVSAARLGLSIHAPARLREHSASIDRVVAALSGELPRAEQAASLQRSLDRGSAPGRPASSAPSRRRRKPSSRRRSRGSWNGQCGRSRLKPRPPA